MESSDFLKLLRSEWLPIISKLNGDLPDAITREELAHALEAGNTPPPPPIRELLAKIVRNDFKFKKGIKPRPYPLRRDAVEAFLGLLDSIKHAPELSQNATKRGEKTNRDLAKDAVANKFSIDTRTLENWRKEHERIVLEAHRRSGHTFKTLHQALEFERKLYAQARYRANLQGWPLPPLK